MRILPGRLDLAEQKRLLAEIRQVLAQAPLFSPVMPRSGSPYSVRMSNCGPLGWLSDRSGYRYTPVHPLTGLPWPEIPAMVLDLWREATGTAYAPEACLINCYGPEAKLGLHRDQDEEARDAPILSISLGDIALFRIGGPERRSPTRSLRLASGDVLILSGPSRRWFHGAGVTKGGRPRTLQPLRGRVRGPHETA